MFSQTTDYALRAVVCLAAHHGKPQTTEQIAQFAEVPAGYLSKVLQTLGRAGIVSAQRGVGGGYTLVKSPEELTVLEVVNAVDPIERIHCCPLGRSEHGVRLCPLHKRLDAALALIEDSFRSCTISDVLEDNSGNPPLRAGDDDAQREVERGEENRD